MPDQKQTKEIMKPRRKMGKTLLVNSQHNSDTQIDASYFNNTNLTGLVKTTYKDGKFFLLFGDYLQAKDALNKLKKEFNYFVKFVHYNIFFKCSQLVNETPTKDFEHTTFKEAMRKLVQEKTNGHVLYAPRLYLTSDKKKYVGCGNITVDTKECEEELLNRDGSLKFSKIGENNRFEVAFYRFRQGRDDVITNKAPYHDVNAN
ncbi:hypothetical protein crov209 [Cafeteria roenbergensis virus]|uniref:Uncharacterized protein n=1 Tax=Cafeteria roenbergensis virus (strain BV-PW1) TaxID=693272 RepID=E3T4X9_CROVB|nr:hypothetical protein crov209 [Cafeteria roenbergensis virus BV-PW1]ADO67242.1 hypothetical protein crov209 [Cafeteria roenbergensis virus BV-PW1]